MNMENALITVNGKTARMMDEYNPERVELLKRTICKDSTDDELALFVAQCKRTGLDPFARQIHAVKRPDKKAGRDVIVIQVGIDGYRLIAERTGAYQGQTMPQWCGEDGVWVDVWLKQGPPAAARVGVHKAGFKDPVFGVALWNEYVQQYYKDGWQVSPMWKKMGALMLSKCAESLALRKAFPQELSGLYTAEEMQQADTVTPEAVAAPEAVQAIESEPAPVVRDEVKAGWVKWRKWFNPKALKCTTLDQLEKLCAALAESHKGEPNIWAVKTWHNDTETFGSLRDVHMDRIARDNPTTAPDAWRGAVSRADANRFPYFQEQYNHDPALQTQENADALSIRGRELGLPEYADDDGEELAYGSNG